MLHFRPFRNGDPPALAALWNRGVPEVATVRPLTGHEFDGRVVNRPDFEADALIVAERDGHLAGFVHAGFGPEDPLGPPLKLNREMGTVAMLVVEPGPEVTELEQGLVAEAERYLRRRGASVLYAGGQYPLNPFYWGLYGGSEWGGVLSGHSAFHRAVCRAGYEPASATVLLEADLSAPEIRDPRAPLIRRSTRVEVEDDEDAPLPSWWDALAIGEFRPVHLRLRSRSDGSELARATTWDMTAFGRSDNRSRVGLINMEVPPAQRRRGYGRHLVGEIMRQARTDLTGALAVQTGSTNQPALALYESLGFRRVETATLYRLPAERTGRAGSAES